MASEAQLGLYVARSSQLHNLNPLTKLVLAGCIIVLDFVFPNYWMSTILAVGVLLPLCLWGKIGGPVMRVMLQVILPLAAFLFIIQGLFYPEGKTILWQLGFLSVKKEGIEFAYLTSARLVTMVGAMLLVLCTTHPSTLMADLSRRKVSPTLTYIVISTLQLIPQTQAKARTIIDAQRARGLATEGGFYSRIKALLPLIIPLILGSLQETEERAIALEARAFKARRPKTSLVIVPDSLLQQRVRIGLMVITVLLLIGAYIWR
ncbi:energy-coupling factor transporter transmembrane protein EcfT [Ktedonosporobacter rubrisoli]|uniref:Energy-coupling factor transporter transmembrane protein EcfT n=1 Tax=Ktedonosporobacter rubrisoli TaxID=2509675 RepID=A0A4P6JQB7_KTERU|nr:energy-coupling factor transporter transmembrane component T [Ktedonosporobacter rubrisoli]QBD77599.1 energy-coupling factor transporter transmembrane protein EcfT [Ktedonosporobacter rubrisoli]